MFQSNLSNSLIDEGAAVEFGADDLVLVVTRDCREIARAVRAFNLRTEYERYVGEDGPNTIDHFYRHLFTAELLTYYEGPTKEMHLDSGAGMDGTITVYGDIG
jgi:hypothetical protein